MRLEDKYSNTKDNRTGKVIISDDAYAICEFMELLRDSLNEVKSSIRSIIK